MNLRELSLPRTIPKLSQRLRLGGRLSVVIWIGIGMSGWTAAQPSPNVQPVPQTDRKRSPTTKPEAIVNHQSIDGVLLLRSGGLLAGKVHRAGEVYEVVRHQGRAQLRVSQVVGFFKTRSEAYFHRRDLIAGGSWKAHLELARWCLRNQLTDHAATELKTAQRLSARVSAQADPQIARFSNELTRAQRQPTLSEQQGAQQASPTIRLATHEQLSHERSSPPPPRSQRPALPRGVQAAFVRTIQPMLVAGCATTGCHAPGGPQHFQLDRLAVHGRGHQVLVQRNLESIMLELDPREPEASPMLRFARAEHGGRDTAAVARYGSSTLARDRYERLRAWCYQALQQPHPDELEAKRLAEAAFVDAQVSAEATARGNSGLAEPQSPKSVAVTTGRDEFDAAIFNARTSQSGGGEPTSAHETH